MRQRRHEQKADLVMVRVKLPLADTDARDLKTAIVDALDDLESRLLREFALKSYQQGKAAGEALSHYQRVAAEAERELAETAIPIRFDDGKRYTIASFSGGGHPDAREGDRAPRQITLAVERPDAEEPEFFDYALVEKGS